MGLAYDKLVMLGLQYIEQGSITRDEMEDFREYLIAYKALRAGVAKLKEAFPLWREAQRTVREGLGPGRLSRLLADLSLAVDAAGGHPERSAGHPERSEGTARA
jgi:hypothetical protein